MTLHAGKQPVRRKSPLPSRPHAIQKSSAAAQAPRTGRLPAASLAGLQSAAGNQAVQRLVAHSNPDSVQRDLIEAGKVASPGLLATRPKEVKRIDASLAVLVQKLQLPGALDPIKAALTDVLKAISDFHGSKHADGKWHRNVASLENEVKQKEAEVDAKLASKAQGAANFAAFNTLEPDLAQYAVRSALSAAQFEPEALGAAEGPSVKSALLLPRGQGGELSDEAIAEMNTYQQSEIEKEKGSQEYALTLGNLTIEQIQAMMDKHSNALTKQTSLPELRNITSPLDPAKHPDRVVVTPVEMGGATMLVEHNESDVNFPDRLKLVEAAVEKVNSKGIKVPDLHIHMPKFGRAMKAGADAKGELSCEETEKSSRAVFVPPGFLHLSSEIIGNPLTKEVTNPATGAKEFEFSSTGFDPGGTATIVHELGHVMHYISAPGKFHGAWGTVFKAEHQKTAMEQVSQYGKKPREFVAEVFLGLVYGKTFNKEVLKMYSALGGAMPPGMDLGPLTAAQAAVKAI
jgi:Skp family chaperone for outer membrane proteins